MTTRKTMRGHNVAHDKQKRLRTFHLFAGAGGGILADLLLGHVPVGACEIEPYPRAVLLQRQRDGILPEFPIWDDIRTLDGRPWRGKVDMVSGGFPCQDISWAWKGAGIQGQRSGLWVEMHRIINEVKPRYAIIENVGNIRTRGLGVVVSMLREIGYTTTNGDFCASDCGAPHMRNRTFIFAARDWTPVVFADECFACEMCGEPVCPYCRIHYSECSCPGPHSEDDWRVEEEDWGIVAYNNVPRREEQWWPGAIQKKYVAAKCPSWWGAESRLDRVAHGVANRVDRIKAIGNGQVPAVAALAWEILATEHERARV